MQIRAALPIMLVLAAAALAACERRDTASASLTRLPSVGAEGSAQPRLTATPDGAAVLSWIEPRADAQALDYAVLRDGAWAEPVTVVERPDLFANWADLPSVVQLAEGRWVAHFLVLQPGTYAAYDIEYAISTDGRAWTEPVRLNDDSTEAEHGFATLFDWDGGTGAVWLDGRNLAMPEAGSGNAGGSLAGVELRFARLDADGSVLDGGIVDELACDCCKTDVASTRSGPVLTYRDRTPEEIRDVVVRRFDGAAWSAPERLGDDDWRIEGCPVNGPAIASAGDSVAVAWFTGAGGRPRVQLAWSTDAGRSFGSAIEIDSAGSFGQADVVLLDERRAVVSWWRRAAGEGIVLAARSAAADGSLGPVREVARSDMSQPLDVPQLERSGDGLVFAWTTFDDNLRVETAYAENWP